MAQAELEVRGVVYTYDALAWALLKNGRYRDAEQASERALRFGTPEPAFQFHAGMIAAALGRKDAAAKSLDRALALNPRFEIRQADIAAVTLSTLRHP